MKANMSNSHCLRGIITEKLSMAASEILAAVERTLAVYEAEASGLRQELELERQKWQPELFQPRVKEEPSEFENTQRLEMLSYTGGLEVEQHIGKQDPDFSSRLTPSAVLTDRINVNRSHVRNLENYVDLKICILKDWTIEVVSDQVDEEYPVHELQCCSGLQEANFLNLLRSTFPQLASHTPFESFITDSSKRLQPLKVESFTPEQICSAAGNSTIYIRLKCPVEHEAGSQQQPVQVSDDDFDENDCYNEDASSIPLQTAPDAKSEPPHKKRAEDQIAEDEHILLRVHILEDSHISVLSQSVLKKYKLKKLKCPHGMQEAEFLKLLRSTFPQLAANRPFEYFMTNLTNKLLPLNLESITPEQICRAAGSSALYIRLKPVEEKVQASQKNPKQRKAVDHKDDKNNSSSTTKQTMPKKQNASPHKQWVRETDTHINLRIHLLEDSKIKAVTPEVLKKYKLHKLQCPRGMKEADFLRLLKSTLPKLAAQTYFETFKSDQHRKLLPLNVKSFTPEMLSAAAGDSALYIRLKQPMNLKNRNQVTLQKTQGDAHPSSPHPATPKPENDSPSCNRVDDKDPHINLSICFLEDSHVDVLAPPGEPAAPSSSNGNPNLFFNKYPIHELKCPRGLQETDFLDLLKSTFPQLADGQPLTVLALQGRKMIPLKVDSVIPEEIRRASNSVRSPVICIQLTKKPLQKEGSDPADLPTTTHPSTPDTSIQSPSRTSGGPPNRELDNLLDLRFCILDDLSIDVLSPLALQKYPIVEFQCPGNLQKADFLNLLRSTFPQLAREAFEFLTGHGKNMRPIDLENLTSDEFSRTLRLAGSSVLYIRLKELRKVQASVKRTLPDVSDQSGVCPSKRVKKQRKRAKVQSSKSHRDEESENDETEDSEDDNEQKNSKSAKLSESLMPKYKARSELVNLTDESSDATANIQIDDETDDSEDENYYKNPQFSRLSFLQSHIPGYSPEQNTETEPVKKMKEEQSSAKVGGHAEDEETEDSEDYNEHENLESSRLLSFPTKRSGDNTKQNTIKEQVKKKEVQHAAVTHGLKIEQVTIVDCEDRDDDKKAESTRLSSLQLQISGQVAKQSSSTEDVIVVEQNEDIDTPNITTNIKIEEVEFIHSEDDTGESCRTLSPQPQTSSEDSEQHNTTDTGISTATNKNMLSCKVCKGLHSSRRILARHAWRHVDDQSRLCGVCGMQFNSASAIRYHLETYQKTHKCKICDKTLLSLQGFKGHMNRHKGKEGQHQHPEPAQE